MFINDLKNWNDLFSRKVLLQIFDHTYIHLYSNYIIYLSNVYLNYLTTYRLQKKLDFL